MFTHASEDAYFGKHLGAVYVFVVCAWVQYGPTAVYCPAAFVRIVIREAILRPYFMQLLLCMSHYTVRTQRPAEIHAYCTVTKFYDNSCHSVYDKNKLGCVNRLLLGFKERTLTYRCWSTSSNFYLYVQLVKIVGTN